MSRTMETVVGIVRPLAGVEVAQVTRETRIIDDFDVASADLIDIVLELEKAFGVRIGDEETAGLETIGDVCDLIDRKTADAPAAEPGARA